MTLESIINDVTDANVKKFLKNIQKDLAKKKVNLYLDSNFFILGKDNAGWFCEEDKNNEMSIRCYVDLSSPEWLAILLHEWIHCCDCISHTQEYVEFQGLAFNADDVIKKKKLPPNIYKTRDVILNLEWKTEKETIRLLKKFKLPVDIKKYAQEANLMLYKYLILFSKLKTWPNLTPKVQEQIVSNLPTELLPREEFCLTKMPPLVRSQLEELRVK